MTIMTDYGVFYGIYDNPGERFFLMLRKRTQRVGSLQISTGDRGVNAKGAVVKFAYDYREMVKMRENFHDQFQW